MEYRELGITGLKLSSLSYGASSLGGVFHNINESEGIRSVFKAIDLGINFIDVSPYYGLTKAETVLGKALKDIQRDKYVLATKVGRYGAEEKDFDFSATRVRASVDESLQRLNVDHIDLIQVHDMEFGDLDLIVEETIPELQKIRDEGKVRFVGITCLPLQTFLNAVDRLDKGAVDSILSYCHFGLNDTSLLDIADAMEAKDIGIINASPTGMGLLSNRGAPDWHPAPTEVQQRCKEAADFCAAQGTDIAELAMQFSVSSPRICTTLFSTSKPENVEANVAAVNEPIDTELLAEVQKMLAPIHNVTWSSGRPENCVAKVNS